MADLKPAFTKVSAIDLNLRQKFQVKRADGFAKLGFCKFSIVMFLSFAANAQSLNDAIRSAWANDAVLQSAAANRVVAKENVNIAKSRLLPQASIQGSQSSLSQTTTQTTTIGPQSNSFKGESYNFSFLVRQGVIRPRDWVGLTLGKQQAYYGELKFQSAKSDLWSRTSGVWIDLIAAQMSSLSYDAAIKTISESATQERIRFEKGDGTKDAYIEAQAQLLQAKALLKDSELNLKSKYKAFVLLTGSEPRDWMEKKLPLSKFPSFDTVGKENIWERILETTPELLASRVIENINKIKVDQAYYDQLPTVDMYGQASRAQNDTTNTLGYHYQNQQVGVQLSVPLYTGGGLQATMRQSAASYEASIADRESLKMRIEAQFISDWLGQEGLSERAYAAKSLVLSAEEQKRATLLGFQKGIKTWTDLSNIELLLARRTAELISIQQNIFKLQARILSLLPVDDEAWDSWIQQFDSDSSR